MPLTPQSQKNNFGPLIRAFRLRSKQRLTQAELAERLAERGLMLHRSAIARIEKQKRGLSDIELLHILEVLKVDMTGLIDRALFLDDPEENSIAAEIDQEIYR